MVSGTTLGYEDEPLEARIIVRALLLFIAITLAVTASAETPTKAAPKGEVEIAKDQLKTLITLLDSVRRPIERFNLGGWVVLRRQVDAVIDTIDRNHGVGNDETSEAYKELIFQIETSKDYFQTIETDQTKKDIGAIQATSDQIRAMRKMTGTIFARNTFRMFTKIQNLIDVLKTLPISPQLRQDLMNLDPQMRAVFAQDSAQGGDRPKTYQEGIKAVLAIRRLYPQFIEAGVDNQIFVTVSSIQGFVEQYAFIANMAVQQKDEDGAQR